MTCWELLVQFESGLQQIPQVFHFVQLDSDCPPACRNQRFVVAKRLGAEQGAEGHALGGDFHVSLGIVHDLNEPALVGTALVELSRGMLEARTKPSRDGAFGLFADGYPHGLQNGFGVFVARNVGVDSDEISSLSIGEKCL